MGNVTRTLANLPAVIGHLENHRTWLVLMHFLFHWWHSGQRYEDPGQPSHRHRSPREPSHTACPPAGGIRHLALLEFTLRLVQPVVGLRITTSVDVVLEGFHALTSCMFVAPWP
ncbi:hypothetical protein V6N13_032097 [Hibiscus sabdariffa]|uniref:Uncharacterized protein n=1 Tax=Hibiscus sabdariffa TaxID=183260 RepID=A0ABR2AV26_9ROSI